MPPIRSKGTPVSNAAGEPDISSAMSTPYLPVADRTAEATLAGCAMRVAPNSSALRNRIGLMSQHITSAAPATLNIAQAVTPSVPAPCTSAEDSLKVPAALNAAATVAVAQFAGQAVSSLSVSGMRRIEVPGPKTQNSASPPVNSLPGCSGSWPYLIVFSHFCGNWRTQKKHLPQLDVIAHVTRSPGASDSPFRSSSEAPAPIDSIRPIISCPRIVGVGATRRPS